MPFDRELGRRVLDAVRRVGERRGVSAARVSLSWLLDRPGISSVIIAARKKEHLADNIAAG